MVSKKSSTFAPAFEKALPNCVMVALQILVLSVWVRVLVRQQKKKRRSSLFFLCEPALTQRFLALMGTIITYLVSLERLLQQLKKKPSGDAWLFFSLFSDIWDSYSSGVARPGKAYRQILLRQHSCALLRRTPRGQRYSQAGLPANGTTV